MRSIIDMIEPHMNRKKKLNSILKKMQKKKNAKLTHNNKARYIAKADREEELPQVDTTTTSAEPTA